MYLECPIVPSVLYKVVFLTVSVRRSHHDFWYLRKVKIRLEYTSSRSEPLRELVPTRDEV